MSTDMEKHGWGPGWPHCQGGKIKTLVRKDGLRIALREELIPLFVYLFDETERRGYDIVPNWTWGYACRAVRGSRTVGSNHSNGGAVDINAPKNPMKSPPMVTDMPGWMPILWEAHMFRWGGRYRNRPDAMHYEFWGTPSDAERIIRGLGESSTNPAPAAALRANQLPIVLHKGNKSDPYTKSYLIEIYQTLLNKWIVRYKPKQVRGLKLLKVDGTYGPTTANYTIAWKSWMIQFQKDFKLARWPDTSTYVGALTFGALQKFTS